MLRLQAGLAQRRGKGLIDFVIGQAFGLARILLFFGGHSQRRQSLAVCQGRRSTSVFWLVRQGLPGCPALKEREDAPWRRAWSRRRPGTEPRARQHEKEDKPRPGQKTRSLGRSPPGMEAIGGIAIDLLLQMIADLRRYARVRASDRLQDVTRTGIQCRACLCSDHDYVGAMLCGLGLE